MIKFNFERKLTGAVSIYRPENKKFKKIPKTLLREKIEEMEFDNREIQDDLKVVNGLLVDINNIILGSNREKEIRVFLDPINYGAKIPTFIITGNYPLYNLLKKLTQ